MGTIDLKRRRRIMVIFLAIAIFPATFLDNNYSSFVPFLNKIIYIMVDACSQQKNHCAFPGFFACFRSWQDSPKFSHRLAPSHSMNVLPERTNGRLAAVEFFAQLCFYPCGSSTRPRKLFAIVFGRAIFFCRGFLRSPIHTHGSVCIAFSYTVGVAVSKPTGLGTPNARDSGGRFVE